MKQKPETSQAGRRRFLKGLAATAGWVWAGAAWPRALEAEDDDLPSRFAVDPRLPGDAVFPQGVASGDPESHGITLWTRVAARPGERVRLAYEIAADPSFTRPLLRGVADTAAARDHTLKIHIQAEAQLAPFETYYFRFIHRRRASPTGRFKTLPSADADLARVRFAFISCQDYTNGYYTALAHLAEEDIDFVVHLGDYIYETVADPSFQSGQVRTLQLPSGADRAETLADYRFLYQTYKSDPDLKRLHARHTLIAIWDDHEFANDSYREYDTDSADESQNYAPERRRAANQAWAEYLPAQTPFDPAAGPLEQIRIYRHFAFGQLMDLVMTDQRLYRDGPPCGLEERNRYLTPGCDARLDAARTMLGPEQRAWFLDTLTRSPGTWKIWGSEVMLMQLKLLQTYTQTFVPQAPAGDLYFTLDQWDGYPAERAALLRTLADAGIKNLVAVTGDIHTFFAGHLKTDFDTPLAPPVGVEFVCASVTSANLGELATYGHGVPLPAPADLSLLVRASNPHIVYFNSFVHGYCLMDVTPTAVTCTLRAVSTVKSPEATVSTLKTFRVPAGEARIVEVPADEPTPVPA